MKYFIKIVVVIATMSIFALGMTACSSSGGSGYSRTSVHYGYRGYRGHPWGYGGAYYPDYPGGGVGDGSVDPDWGVDAPSAPIAMPMPDMGMPDFGGMDAGGMDFDF
jgi:hypothetical protein